MDVIDFWSKQVEAWNLENKCGECWKFGAPLTLSGVTKTELSEGEECCVHVFMTNLEESIYNQYASTGLLRRREQTYNMTMYFLKQDADLGQNVWNEIPDHPVSESKWAMILKPIKDCVKAENVLDFCTHLGLNAEINSFRMFTEINTMDGYTGWSLQLSIKIRDED